MTLSIIIVNYNVYDLLKECLKSIYDKINDINFEIIVADNNSPDREIDNIKKEFPDVKYLSFPENLGFAKANNEAVKKSNGKYLLFLNPDTLITENFLTDFIKLADSEPEAGVLAPMLVYKNNKYQSSTGPKMGIFYDLLEAFNFVNLFRNYQKNKYFKKINKIYLTSWVSAACMFMRKIDFDRVSGFTASYFLNYEDIDLCAKITSSGKSIFYLPKYKCTHIDHKSFKEDYELLITSRYLSRINYYFLHKNLFQRILSAFIHINGLLFKLIFVNIAYSGNERKSRRLGYYKSLLLYFK